MKWMLKLSLMALLAVASIGADAQSCSGPVCNAATANESDVIAAWPTSGNTNSTVTINIPSSAGLSGGVAVWTSQFTETQPAGVTNIIIQGASGVNCTGTPGTATYACTATDATVIQDNIAANFGVMQINGASGSNPSVRVTGITWKPGTGGNKFIGDLLFYSNSNTAQVQVDHNHFVLTGGPTGWAGRFTGCWTGVVTANVFDNASPSDTGSVAQDFMHLNTCNDSLGNGDGSWAFPVGFGTRPGWIYEENNIVNGGLQGDCSGAGKWVSRYNTLNSNSQSSSWIHNHGTESNGGRTRGCMAMEVYHDYFNIAGSGSVLVGDAGGTMLVWGNTSNHPTTTFLGIGDERNDGQHAQGTTPGNWGLCGTSTIDPGTGFPNNVGSPWDGNADATGWPCLDGIGRGTGTQSLNGAAFPGALNTTTGTISWPHEYLQPLYAWMNSISSTPQYSTTGTASKVNRDFYTDCGATNSSCSSGFNGSFGTGFGTLANRPSACTAGPGGTFGASPTGSGSLGTLYFATDANAGQGEAYVCIVTGSPGTWAPYYQPYQYPYPTSGVPLFTMTVSTNGTGSGTVSGANCSSTTLPSGTVVTCNATPSAGSVFAGWGGNCSGTGACTFTVSNNSLVTATFNTSVTTFTLAVSTTGSGAGTVTPVSGATCSSGTFGSGTTISCVATPSGGSTFAGWSGSGGCTGTGACTFPLAGNSTVIAAFNTIAAAATPVCSPGSSTQLYGTIVNCSSATPGCTTNIWWAAHNPPTTSDTNSSLVALNFPNTYYFQVLNCPGSSNSLVQSYTWGVQVATPVMSPVGGSYSTAQTVTITDSTPSALIFYTTDGSTPTTSSTPYTGPFTVGPTTTTTVNAIATATGGYTQSAVGTATYIFLPATANPVITPAAGTYTLIQTVSMTDSTGGATIHYTVDGTTPTPSSPTYTAPFTINNNTTVSAMAVASGRANSGVVTNAYTINLPGLWNSLAGWDTCILPSCQPGGTGIPVTTAQTIRNATPSLSGSSMLFSLTANAPSTNALWTYYGADNDLSTNTSADVELYPVSSSNLGAIEFDSFLFSVGLNREFMWGMQYCLLGAGCPGGHNSWDVWNQGSGVWVDTGVTTPPNFAAWNHIQTTNHRIGNTQWYDTLVLNGVTHTLNIQEPSSVLPTGWASGSGFQFQMNAATTTGTQVFQMYLDNATFTSSTTPTAATPTFSPVAGTYGSTQTVTISSTTPTATIYYTTDGTTPTTSSTVYTAPISVAVTTTVQAIAVASGFFQSTVGSALYTIQPTATPVFSPVAGTYVGTQTVSITCSTGSSTIHYTTDGTTPTTSSSVYSTPLSISTTTTLKAIATAASHSQSAVASGLYTINAPPVTATPTFSPVAGTYTSTQTVSILDSTVGAVIHYTTDGSTPTTGSPVYSVPLTISATATVKAVALAPGFSLSTVGSALYTIVTPPQPPTLIGGFTKLGGSTQHN